MHGLLPELWLDIACDLLTVCKLTMVSNILKDLLANKHEVMNDDPSDNDILSLGIQKHYRYIVLGGLNSGISNWPIFTQLMKDGSKHWLDDKKDKINQPEYYACSYRIEDIIDTTLLSPYPLSIDDIRKIIPNCDCINMRLASMYSLIDDKDHLHNIRNSATEYNRNYNVFYAYYSNNSILLKIIKNKK